MFIFSELQAIMMNSSSPWLQPFILCLLPFILTILFTKYFFSNLASHKNMPPSPLKLPIIGHMHKLGTLPHRTLQRLSQKHGPLMLLHFGSIPTLVVSSPEAAEEIMKTHDLKFANRIKTYANQKLLYDYKDVSVAPYGEYWRRIKSFCMLQLLSNKRVQSISKIREEETNLLVKKIAESESSPSGVNLSEILLTLTSNVVSMAVLGRKFDDEEGGKKLRESMKGLVGLLGRFDVGTFIPWLAWINTISGFNAEVEKVCKENDEFLEEVLEQHIDAQKFKGNDSEEVGGTDDFVDVLLGVYEDNKTISGFSMSRDSIKALILDMLAGGTDTTQTVLEWAMTELLRHPEIMKKAQNEVRNICKGKTNFTYPNDFENMHYLKAVIKETLRLYPPLPLLVPRIAREDVKVMGYDIAAGTMVIINAWANGRDPSSWEEPEEFRPERFLNSTIDFRGHDCQLIPFGAGRRGCPGISFAMVTNEFVLANLLCKFDWKLPKGMKEEDLDMNECTGLTIHRNVPLLVVATPYPS